MQSILQAWTNWMPMLTHKQHVIHLEKPSDSKRFQQPCWKKPHHMSTKNNRRGYTMHSSTSSWQVQAFMQFCPHMSRLKKSQIQAGNHTDTLKPIFRSHLCAICLYCWTSDAHYVRWTKRPVALEIHRIWHPGRFCGKDSNLMPSLDSSSMCLCHSWQQPDFRVTTRATATLSARLWSQGMTRRVGVARGGAQPSQGTHHRLSGCSCFGVHSKCRL